MRIMRNAGGVKLWLSARDTYDWANRPGKQWPCSELSGRRLFAEFDSRGDLVDMAINGRSADCSADEFNAIVADHIGGKA